MVEVGVVPVVAELSNSYSEENQLYCGKALCNLGCHFGSELKIVEQGGVSALMMICMVRAVNPFTKQTCAKALLNLLIPEIVEARLDQLAKEGLVQAASSLSKLDDEITMRVCANVFCMLSAAPGGAGRRMLVERRATLADMFALMRSHDRTTQVTVGKCACNLLSFADSQAAAVGAGAVAVLKNICTLGDPESEKDCADAFFLISGSEKFRNQIVRSEVLPSLIILSRSTNYATRWSVNRILLNLAWNSSSRDALLSSKVGWRARTPHTHVMSLRMALRMSVVMSLSSQGGLVREDTRQTKE